MSTGTKTLISEALDPHVLLRIVEEGYGEGAWHGPDMKAAVADVTDELAFWRPSPGRHNIAEIALHHAWYVRSVRGLLSGLPLDPFVAEGEDWFPLTHQSSLSWMEVRSVLDSEYFRLAAVIRGVTDGRVKPSQKSGEQLDLVLGITCHAVYHAGQIQLIKRLAAPVEAV
jgi:hypothetical protein